MAKSVKAPATPAVLVWARQSASMELEEVAARFNTHTMTPERVASWEAGEDQPSIAQLRRLSEFYKRPLAVFFLPEAPREFPVPRDFRRVVGQSSGRMSSALRFELRTAQERRDAALRFYEDLEEEPPVFALAGTMREAPATLAKRAREALGFSIDQQFAWRDQYEAMRNWKNQIESLGVLVFQVSGLPSSEMRGFSIAEMPLPVMGINRGETPRARIFSMMHELTHLMVRKGGMCDFSEDDDMPPESRKIEVFCNAVASEILAPATIFLAQNEIALRERRPQEWGDDTIKTLGNRFNVSRDFIVRRLLDHGYCTPAFYREKRELYFQQFLANRASSTAIEAERGKRQQRILGDAFVRLTIDTYRNGHMTLSDLLGHLQIKAKHLHQLESQFGVI